jgi:hypothetical protein
MLAFTGRRPSDILTAKNQRSYWVLALGPVRGFEVKKPGGRPSPEQLVEKVRQKGEI